MEKILYTLLPYQTLKQLDIHECSNSLLVNCTQNDPNPYDTRFRVLANEFDATAL